MTDIVKADLEVNPWPPAFFERPGQAADRRARTHALINQFIEGQNLTMGVGKDDVDVKCLSPMVRVADWRVIELRASEGSRLTRVIGELAAPDIFVALKIQHRKLIFDWDKTAGHVDAEWLRLFPGVPPLHWNAAPKAADIGRNFSDY